MSEHTHIWGKNGRIAGPDVRIAGKILPIYPAWRAAEQLIELQLRHPHRR